MTTIHAPGVDRGTSRVDGRAIGLYVLVAFGGAWLVCLPLWLAPLHLGEPWARLVLFAMMTTPALAAIVASLPRWRGWRAFGRLTGLGCGGSFRRALPYLLLALFGVLALAILAPFVGSLFGLYHADLAHLSGYHAELERALHGHPLPVSTGRLVAVQLAIMPIAAIVPNALLALGEELGWRGWLLPKLLPLGQWPALVIVGVVWGLWHAPIILLGYEYPLHRDWGVLLMVGFTVVTGILFGWLRLATGSVWPSVLAHGALNASAGAVLLFVRAGTHLDTALVGVSGVTGWILPAAVIALLVGLRRLPVRRTPGSTGVLSSDPWR